MIYIVDFGSQTAHLIKRRISDLGALTRFITPDAVMAAIQKEKPHGIILSGGPSSVYDSNSPTLEKKIFSMNIPVLAICYGMQLMMHQLGGTVISGKKEYGPAVLVRTSNKEQLLEGIPHQSTVWMSHGDEVTVLPQGFETIAATDNVQYACVADPKRKLFGMLFHPEVEHTEYGEVILKNFVALCNTPLVQKEIDIQGLEKGIRWQVGDSYVIGAVSGGVDSTVAAALTARAIGEKFVPFYVDNGLMREGTTQQVKAIFKHLGVPVDIIEVEEEMLERLKGVEEPEEKRKIIGNFYIEVFEREMKKLKTAGKDVQFLLQGTIYSDVIESKGTKYASKIKSHHNVLGLPQKMRLKLLEPLRNFYKDEVRAIGIKLGLPNTFVYQQPFPGPGYAIRIRGEVTKKRLEKERIADRIVLEELKKLDFYKKYLFPFLF